MCGKYNEPIKDGNATTGSPPHVREILFNEIWSSSKSRITPACAGNTNGLIGTSPLYSGSPPHVREIRMNIFVDCVTCGITPACAGNTLKDPSMTLPAI